MYDQFGNAVTKVECAKDERVDNISGRCAHIFGSGGNVRD